jgi:hypothetical protein
VPARKNAVHLFPIVPRIAAFALLAALASGCTAPHPYVRTGDQSSVEIGYGGNIESAQPVARQFCAQFDRMAQLADVGPDIAYFDCVRRP